MADNEQFSAAQRAFLSYPHYATIATVDSEGGPQLSVVWFDLDSDSLVFTTAPDSLKARHMRRQPNIAISVNHGGRYVAVKGQAELGESTEEGAEWLLRIAKRYYGPAEGQNQFDQFNKQQPSVLVRLRPRKISSVGV